MDQLAERLKNMSPLQRAVFALKETQARLETLERRQAAPIAIVGMACRYPGGAGDPESYWRLLRSGSSGICKAPAERWDVDGFYDPDPHAPGKMCTRWGGFIDQVDLFDNHFFGISDREAVLIDPQQRMLMELSWEALEDAGIPPSSLRGTRTGVFVGISISEYGLILSGDVSYTASHAASGTSLCMAANRLSYVLGLQGPSVAMDTACSSSLVAAHLACQNIRLGDCDMALVAGCNLLLSPLGTVNLTKAGFCAADGRVRAFDAAASGYVRSEGAGVVVLKPLAAALNSGDPIYAVIRGSAVNQNGTGNGLTAPSRAAQEQVLRDAYARAGVSPGQIQYVEAQGTGTRLGDTIEALALGSVLREGREPDHPCSIGSVKTNIGHLETASGVASLMKVALAIKHRQLPPMLHFQTPNPDIPFDRLPLKVQQRLEPWPEAAHPRLAGVSAFGFGGSNAHLVLEEAPAPAAPLPPAGGESGDCLLPISARTEHALTDLAERYCEFLGDDGLAWRDVCYTASVRRDHHDCRMAILAASRQEARQRVQSFLGGQSSDGVFCGRKPFGRDLKLALVYEDRAEDWRSYGARLVRALPGLPASIEALDEKVQRILGWRLAPMLHEDAAPGDAVDARCALLVLHLAAAAWWRAAGVSPEVVVGQGAGELAAACTAGILTAEESLQIAAGIPGTDGAAIQPRPARLPFLSCADGQSHPGPDLGAAHWRTCLTHPGNLEEAVSFLGQWLVDICVGLGPGLVGGNRRQFSRPLVSALGAADRQEAGLLPGLGTLYAAGADLAWVHLAPAGGRHVRLPGYPWQRQRLWAPRGPWRAPATHGESAPAAAPAAPVGTGVEGSEAGEVPLRPRPDLNTPFRPPESKLETVLAQAWSSILGVREIGIHDNFFELGGDSLQATILLNRLREHLGEDIPSHVLFEVQTVGELATYLTCHCADTVARFNQGLEAVSSSGDAEAASSTGKGAPGAPPSIQRLARDEQADQLLSRLDELSDDEVASLLGETSTGDGVDS